MKTKVILASIAFAMVSVGAHAKPTSIDTKKSLINWVGKKVTGQHNGRVWFKAGQVDIDKNLLKGGNFEIDMSSIKVDDLKDPEYNAKLTGHLKSDDFFGVDKHPTSKFKITSVKAVNKNGNTH